MKDGGDELGRGELLELRDAQVQGEDRDRDRDDPVTERLESGGFGSAGYGSGRGFAHDASGA